MTRKQIFREILSEPGLLGWAGVQVVGTLAVIAAIVSPECHPGVWSHWTGGNGGGAFITPSVVTWSHIIG